MGAINDKTLAATERLKERLAALEAENVALRHQADLLGKSEYYYREFLEDLPQPVFDMDLEGRLLYANQTGLKLFGYTLDDMQQGLSVFHLLPEDQHPLAQAAMMEVAQSGLGKFRVYTMRLFASLAFLLYLCFGGVLEFLLLCLENGDIHVDTAKTN